MRSKLVFYDTWAYVALADRSEKSAHQAADRTNRVLLDKRYTPVTTNYILDESLTLIRNRLGHGAAIRFRDDLELGIEANLVMLEWITKAREREAMALFRRYDDKPKLSFTDCTTFIVMRLLDITLAFTADEHFERTDPQNLPFRRLIDQRAGRCVFLERLL